MHTDPIDLGNLFAVLQTFDALYLNGDEYVVIGSGGVFSGGLSEDCWGKGRANAPDAEDGSRLSLSVGYWEFRERN